MNWTEDLSYIREILREELKAVNDQNYDIEDIIDNFSLSLCDKFGGMQFYLPVLPSLKYQRIYDDFTGNNYRQLSVKYRIGESRVRQIINQERKRRLKEKQGDLF